MYIFFSDKSVFPFYPDRDCQGFQDVLERYKCITPGIQLSGPTSFVPLIEKAIEIVSKKSSVCLY
jgi:E3 ubiquitin-protein ligase RGLG